MPGKRPLILVPEGEECRVSEIHGGRGLIRHLEEMGFIEDSPVRVLRSDRGSLIVDVNGCSYALSRGIAMKIIVDGD
jgi:ferrous iron transport protein A